MPVVQRAPAGLKVVQRAEKSPLSSAEVGTRAVLPFVTIANLGLLVAEEEEGVVAVDGATNDAAELIAFERIDGFDAVDVAEVVGSVEDSVADELEEVAVEGVEFWTW